MRIAIVGAGIGGLAAAIALRARGFDPVVYEQADQLREVGAGVQLSANACRVLAALNLMDSVSPYAHEPQAMIMRHGRTGAEIHRRPLGADAQARYGAPYMQIHRAHLHDALRQNLPPGAIRLSKRVIEADLHGGRLRFADETSAEADLIIGADGIHSIIRKSGVGDAPADFTGEIAFRGIAPISAWAETESIGVVWIGDGRHVVQYLVDGGRRMNIVAIVPRQDWRSESWSSPATREEMLAEFDGWAEPLRETLRAIAQPLKWAIYDRPSLLRWNFGVSTLLGDAAHPMSPGLAQGAAQALEDAYVLAHALEQTGGALPHALSAYEHARLERTARVQLQSRKNQALARLDLSKTTMPAPGPYRSDVASEPMFDWLYGHDVTATPLAMEMAP